MMSWYPAFRLAQWMGEVLPVELGYRLAERLEDAWRWLSPNDRRGVRANLSAVCDGRAEDAAPAAREVFRNFGRYLLEFLTVHRQAPMVFTVSGYDHVVRASQGGRGVIMLTGHFGNWELGAVALSRMGFPMSVVALSHRDPRLTRLFDRQRRRCGIDVIPLGPEASPRCVAALRQGRVLGIVGDRDFGSEGVSVSLLGRPVTVPRGPATFSLRTGAPLIACFMERTGRWRFHFHIDPPLYPTRDAGASEEVLRLTQAYVAAFERYIRRCPAQWVLFRPFTPPLRAGFTEPVR